MKKKRYAKRDNRIREAAAGDKATKILNKPYCAGRWTLHLLTVPKLDEADSKITKPIVAWLFVVVNGVSSVLLDFSIFKTIWTLFYLQVLKLWTKERNRNFASARSTDGQREGYRALPRFLCRCSERIDCTCVRLKGCGPSRNGGW